MSTLVKFRKDKSNEYSDNITAVFPQLKYNKRLYGNSRITCYAHVGQHSGATIEWVKEDTIPATFKEYLPLLKELKSIGYNNLKICK